MKAPYILIGGADGRDPRVMDNLWRKLLDRICSDGVSEMVRPSITHSTDLVASGNGHRSMSCYIKVNLMVCCDGGYHIPWTLTMTLS